MKSLNPNVISSLNAPSINATITSGIQSQEQIDVSNRSIYFFKYFYYFYSNQKKIKK